MQFSGESGSYTGGTCPKTGITHLGEAPDPMTYDKKIRDDGEAIASVAHAATATLENRFGQQEVGEVENISARYSRRRRQRANDHRTSTAQSPALPGSGKKRNRAIAPYWSVAGTPPVIHGTGGTILDRRSRLLACVKARRRVGTYLVENMNRDEYLKYPDEFFAEPSPRSRKNSWI